MERRIFARHKFRAMKKISSICLLGSGNVATHLAFALQQGGYQIKGIYSRTLRNAQELASKLDCALATDRLECLPAADAYIFSVKDDVLPHLAQRLAGLHPQSKALFIHTAGSVPLSALGEWVEQAAVLYPMQTFSKASVGGKKDARSFAEIPLFIESSTPEGLSLVEDLAQVLSDHVTELDSERRRKLHLSAVFACNFANHCYAMAYRLLQDAGIDPRCLWPLIDETARKVHTLEPLRAQTGPAVRWDERVMGEQTEALAAYPEMQEIYKAMSHSIHTYHDKLRPETNTCLGI